MTTAKTRAFIPTLIIIITLSVLFYFFYHNFTEEVARSHVMTCYPDLADKVLDKPVYVRSSTDMKKCVEFRSVEDVGWVPCPSGSGGETVLDPPQECIRPKATGGHKKHRLKFHYGTKPGYRINPQW
jgi:hypothetical protein